MTNFNRKNYFKVPKGYFEKLEKRLIRNSKSSSNKLDFNVPSGYFDTLEEAVVRKARSLTPPKTQERKATALYYFAGIAASLTLVFNLIQYQQNQVIEIEDQALNDYIESYYMDNLDSYEMLSMMEDAEIELLSDFSNKP